MLRLEESVALGPVTARNRIVFAPTSVGYARAGLITDEAVSHYARRARGGAGTVMTEHLAVSEIGWQHPGQPGAWSRDHDAGLARLATAIHTHGALAIAQLSHAGRYAGPWQSYTERRRLAPSAVPFTLPVGPVCPDEITPGEIEDVVEQFADAAARVIRAGFDGIEIHGGSGFLLAGFLSPRTNLRTDRHRDGTGVVLDVVTACRRAIGSDAVLGFHLLTDELVVGGVDRERALALVPRLEAAGVDVFRPGAGTFETLRMPANRGLSAGRDFQREDTLALARTSTVAVLAGGGIRDPAHVEAVLAEGEVTAVALARPLLADPDWVAKARAGLLPTGCDCSPPLCLTTQLTGSVCHAWSPTARAQGTSDHNTRNATSRRTR